MRRENLLYGGHDKVIWRRSRNRSRDKRPNNVTLRRGGGVPQQRYLVYYLRVIGDVVETH